MDNELLSKEDYQNAIDSQNACNLSGIVFEFAKAMQKICNEASKNGHGTEWKNTHPIARLYAEQISFLTGKKDWMEAMNECEKNASSSHQ